MSNRFVKNTTGSTKTYGGQDINAGQYYEIQSQEQNDWANSSDLLTDIVSGDVVIARDSSGNNDITDINSAINYLKEIPTDVTLDGVSVEAGRLQNMNNRVPNGYSVYVTGRADDITNGTYRAGTRMKFNDSNTTREFQMLDHYYAIAATAHWGPNASIDNYFNAVLYAPATTGLTNTTGDYDKVNLGGAYNLIKPVTAGTGSWSMDLTAKLTNTSILKATPVPVSGNNGWFDYDSSTNVLTANLSQTGGYNLYDFDVDLHAFGESIWGIKDGISGVNVEGLVGKLLYNCWIIKIDFGLDGGSLSNETANVVFTVATKRNV